jgi:hypothetical protein
MEPKAGIEPEFMSLNELELETLMVGFYTQSFAEAFSSELFGTVYTPLRTPSTNPAAYGATDTLLL